MNTNNTQRTLTDAQVEEFAFEAMGWTSAGGPADWCRMVYEHNDGWNKWTDADRTAIHARVNAMLDDVANPAPPVAKPAATETFSLCPIGRDVLERVRDALQTCEEMHGPGEDGYTAVMVAVIMEARSRLSGFADNMAEQAADELEAGHDDEATRLVALAAAAHTALDQFGVRA